jgi:hypothetical protein
MRHQMLPGLVSMVLGLLLAAPLVVQGAASPAATVPSTAPEEFNCKPAGTVNEIQPPPPIWKLAGRPPSNEERQYIATIKPLCAHGQVPAPVPGGPAAQDPPTTNGEADRVRELSLLGKQPVGPSHNSGERCGTVVEYKEYCYWHVQDQVTRKVIGMEYITDISQPELPGLPGIHSLDQLNLGRRKSKRTGEYIGDTIEAGIGVFHKVPEPKDSSMASWPHFFIYLNNNGYRGSPDCYECAEFTARLGAKLMPGRALKPSAARFRIGVEYWKGNWWFWAGTEWIGYVNSSFWNKEFTQAEAARDYGEVLDRGPLPTSQMGDGQPGQNPGATLMTAPVIIINEHKAMQTKLHERGTSVKVTDRNLYSLGDENREQTEWHFGGSGANEPTSVPLPSQGH